MKNGNLKLLGLFCAAALLQACSHADTEKKIDDELAQETAVSTRTELNNETEKLIESSPGLNTEQRAHLAALRTAVKADTDQMRKESLRLRSLLVKHLISENYDEDMIDLLKKRIRKLEDRRLSETFRAVEEAKGILGHENIASRRKLMDSFFEGTSPRD